MPDPSSPLYDYSVPLFIRQLEQLSLLLKKGEQWCETNGFDKSKLLQASLAEDMRPLIFQVQTCCNGSKSLLVRIGGAEPVPMEDNEESFPQLYERIEATIALLKAAKKTTFASLDYPSPFHLEIGKNEVDFQSPLQFYQNYALPNFFFHMTAAYLIMRNVGVDVGKLDYLGGSTITQPSFGQQ